MEDALGTEGRGVMVAIMVVVLEVGVKVEEEVSKREGWSISGRSITFSR